MKIKVIVAERGFRLSIGSLSTWIGIVCDPFCPFSSFKAEAKHLFIGLEQGEKQGRCPRDGR